MLTVIRKAAVLALAIAPAFATGSVSAQSSVSHQCASVVNPDERLICYDTAFPPGAGVQSAVSAEEKRRKGVEDFGLNRLQLRARSPELMQDVLPDRIESTVTRVSTNADGKRVVTLGNGQVWLLIEPSGKGWLKQGDSVVIREAALSSYMLVTPGGVALRARRTQ